MKCKKCKKKNINKANYCRYCGNVFSEEERKSASEKGLVAGLKKFDDYYETCQLKKITDNKFIKYGLLVGIVAIGIYNVVTRGSNLKLLESDAYNLSYNKEKNEYYLEIKETDDIDKIGTAYLKMYVPNSIDAIYIDYYKEDGTIKESKTIGKEVPIELIANADENNYYLVSDNENIENPFKIYVYYGEEK